jgi:membrane associated rhomboid family serine protease
MIEGRELHPEPTPLELPTRPPARLSPPLAKLLLAYVLLLALPSLVHTLESGQTPFGDQAEPLTAVAALAALGAGLVLLWIRLRPLGVPPVQLDLNELRLPLSEASARVGRVRLAELDWLERTSRRGSERVRLGARGGPVLTLHARTLCESGDLERLWHTLRELIALRPGGGERLEDLDGRASAARERARRPAFVTLSVCAAVAIGYTLQLLGQDVRDPLSIVRFGGNSPSLVARGELFRLVTANFLHAGAIHCYWNLLTLGVLGWRLERTLGGPVLACILGFGALGGTALSALLAAGIVAAGASTMVFAMLAAIVYLNGVHPQGLVPGLRVPLLVALILLATIVLSTLLVSNVDHGGHAGGFVAGLAATAALTRRGGAHNLVHTRSRIAGAVALGLAALFLGGVVAGVRTLRLSPEESFVRWTEALASDVEAHPQLLNEFAWLIAFTHDLNREQLEFGVAAAERAHALEPESDEIRDTLATLLYRVGRFERAIELERQVALANDLPFYWSQIARFERGHTERQGPLLLGADPIPVPRVEGGTLLHAAERPFEAHLLLLAGDEIVGLSRVTIGADAPGRVPLALPDELDPGTRIELALVDSRVAPDVATRSSFDAFDPTVAKLPGPAPGEPGT